MSRDAAPPPRGLLFLVTAPTAAGKYIVLRTLLGRGVDLAWVTTAVTRAPREGEVDGRDHFFLDPAGFESRLRSGWFLETARVYGRLYGTPLHQVQEPLAAGLDVVLRLDVQGARELQRLVPEAIVIFIEPPSVEEAVRRIRERGTESPDEAARRLQAMLDFELDFASRADYRVPNATGELEAAADQVWTIVEAERLREPPRRVDPATLRPWSDPPVEP